MPIAVGLTDTTGEKEAIFVGSVSKLISVVKSGKYATAADSNGAIGVWLDDNGKIRCEAMRHMRTIDLQTVKTFKAAKAWYAEWLKKIA